MRPDRDAVLLRDRGGADHYVRVAGVPAAGDVRRGDDRKHRLIVAHPPGPKPSPMSQLMSTFIGASLSEWRIANGEWRWRGIFYSPFAIRHSRPHTSTGCAVCTPTSNTRL